MPKPCASCLNFSIDKVVKSMDYMKPKWLENTDYVENFIHKTSNFSLTIEIINVNELSPPFSLELGQVIHIPNSGKAYVVKRGDTLFSISRRHNMDQYLIARLNGIRPPYIIYENQKITLKDIDKVVYYEKPLYNYTPYRNSKITVNCPVTERICREVLSLPIHPWIETSDQKKIANAIRKAF